MTGAPKGTGSLAGSTASSRAPSLRKPGTWRRPWPQQRTSRRAGQPSAGNARTRHATAKPDVAAVPPGTTDIGEGARPKRGPKLKIRTPPKNGRDNGKREHLIAAPHPQPSCAGGRTNFRKFVLPPAGQCPAPSAKGIPPRWLVLARTRNRRPRRTRKPEPVAHRSRKAVSTSSTATTLPKKHPQPKLTAHAKTAGSTNRLGTRPRSVWNTTGASPRNSGRRPRNSANAGSVPTRPFLAKRAAPPVLSTTGSPAGAATPGEELWTEEWIQRKNGPRRHRCDSAQNQ